MAPHFYYKPLIHGETSPALCPTATWSNPWLAKGTVIWNIWKIKKILFTLIPWQTKDIQGVFFDSIVDDHSPWIMAQLPAGFNGAIWWGSRIPVEVWCPRQVGGIGAIRWTTISKNAGKSTKYIIFCGTLKFLCTHHCKMTCWEVVWRLRKYIQKTLKVPQWKTTIQWAGAWGVSRKKTVISAFQIRNVKTPLFHFDCVRAVTCGLRLIYP